MASNSTKLPRHSDTKCIVTLQSCKTIPLAGEEEEGEGEGEGEEEILFLYIFI